MPLMNKHHIITQVAGHAIDVVKPALRHQRRREGFLDAFEDVMVGMHKFLPCLGCHHRHRQGGVDEPGPLRRPFVPFVEISCPAAAGRPMLAPA